MLFTFRTRTALLVSLSALGIAGGTALHVIPEVPAGLAGLACVADSSRRVTWVHGPVTDREELDRWCAGVGPAVVQRYEAPVGQRPTSAHDLTVVSWNTNVGGGDLHGFIRALRAGRFTDGDSVEHFVLLLQEVYRTGHDVPRGAAMRPRRIAPRPAHGRRAAVVEVARDHGLHLFYVPSMANGWAHADGAREDRGNAIISTLPLDDHLAIELPFEGQRRVAASATVRSTTPDGRPLPLRVVSVHLDNRSIVSRFQRSFGSGRARQAEALTAALSRDSNALPTVVAGDLNTWAPSSWERAVAVLRAHFPHGNATNGPTYAGRPMGVGRTLDHMLFRLPVAEAQERAPSGPSASTPLPPPSAQTPVFERPVSRRLDDAHGSDHYPLMTRLTLADAR